MTKDDGNQALIDAVRVKFYDPSLHVVPEIDDSMLERAACGPIGPIAYAFADNILGAMATISLPFLMAFGSAMMSLEKTIAITVAYERGIKSSTPDTME